MPGAVWRRLHDRAVEQLGFVTTRDARAADVDPAYLRQMAERGTIQRVAYGLYRFQEVPVTEHTPFMEAVLWVGEDALLSHDAVLSLHGLANANPSVIRVSTPRRVRKSDPPGAVEIIRRTVPAQDVTRYEGIPSTTVARALVDSRSLIMRTRLIEAAHDARAKGLIRRQGFEDVLAKLEQPHG